jgi:membrane-associated protease RseP (regulator of RpoE activity)
VFVYEDDQDGMMVSKLRPEGPAARAGVLAGDRIVRLGDLAVRRDDDLVQALQGLRVGHSTVIEVIREGEHQTLSLTLAPPRAIPAEGAEADAPRCALESSLAHAAQLLAPEAGKPDVPGALLAISQARAELRSGIVADPRGEAPEAPDPTCLTCQAETERCRACLLARIHELQRQVVTLRRLLTPVPAPK